MNQPVVWIRERGSKSKPYSKSCGGVSELAEHVWGEPKPGMDRSFSTALYLSLVTATTLGYGDVAPMGPARIVAVFEAMAGMLLFGALISKFLSRRQERLVEEIHRLSYQDRLGRVQTNLHLVIRELGALSELCNQSDVDPARVRARVESALLVFATETRSIHDLLHHPPLAPTEDIFEGVLAGLSAALDTVHLIQECPTVQAERGGMLQASIDRAAGLAVDICSDCIPGGFAEGLRPWLDRVQANARRLQLGSPARA